LIDRSIKQLIHEAEYGAGVRSRRMMSGLRALMTERAARALVRMSEDRQQRASLYHINAMTDVGGYVVE